MSVADLRKLHALHKIDFEIASIRTRAANLDPGRAIQAQIDRIKAEHDPLEAECRRLSTEQLDLELRQKGIAQKLAKVEKELFGGTIVSPREVEAMQKEIANLKQQARDLDDELLEIFDKLPKAKEAADAGAAILAKKQAELVEHRKSIAKLKEELEASFKEAMRKRPAALEGIPAPMLAKYEQSRQKHGGVAMTNVSKTGMCSQCGTLLPTKLIVAAKDGRVVTCESCHRIIYASDGLI